MNPQPEPLISQALLVIFCIIAAYSFLTYKPKQSRHSLDYFELGYISENIETIHKYVPTNCTVPKPKPVAVKQANQKPIKSKLSPLQEDCINALRSMGMKKSEAIKKVERVFKSVQPKTIQEFIVEAFKREHN